MELQKKFEEFIRKEKLFPPSARLLLAVSGGVDSSVMTELFYRSRYRFGIVHCNFGLRGIESDQDEKFVQRLAGRRKVRFHAIRFDTKKYAKENKLSVQDAARRLRYEFFKKLLREEGYDQVCTAHHLDDSMETFFINLLRGSGLMGLSGIRIRSRDGISVRPLMFASRDEIERFASAARIRFQHDASNDGDDYLRNRIRHQLIPVLKNLNPEFTSVMHRNLDNLAFARALFEDAVAQKLRKMWKHGNLNRKAMSTEKNALALFTEFTRPLGFKAAQAKDLWNSERSGAQVYSDRYVLTSSRNSILLTRRKDEKEFLREIPKRQSSLKVPGKALKFKISSATGKPPVSDAHRVHMLALEHLSFPLTIRRWQAGDSFRPLGMKGRKKVSDFLIDKKVPLPEKSKTYVLLSGGSIVCVLGHRIDDRYKVTDRTKKIFRIEVTGNESD